MSRRMSLRPAETRDGTSAAPRHQRPRHSARLTATLLSLGAGGSTTTDMTPYESTSVASLLREARGDGPLKSLFTKAGRGRCRRRKDPRYKFAGRKGRAEIMAFISSGGLIRGKLPQRFNTLARALWKCAACRPKKSPERPRLRRRGSLDGTSPAIGSICAPPSCTTSRPARPHHHEAIRGTFCQANLP